MKNKIGMLILALTITLNGCSPKINQTSLEVNYLTSIDGTITLRALGEGANENALISASEKVFDVILFRGVPESNEKIAMVGTNEIEEKLKNKIYFDKMYGEKRYRSFIMSAIPTSKSYKLAGSKKTGFDIKVNTNALRRDLEQNNIIRKFGY